MLRSNFAQDRLSLVSTRSSTNGAESGDVYEGTWHFPCPLEDLWAAWASTDSLSEWLHPRGAATPLGGMHLDLRPGGKLAYTLIEGGSGDAYQLKCAFDAVEEMRNLSFRWGPGQPGASLAVTIHVRFVKVPSGSKLAVTLTDLSAYTDGRTARHWEATLDNLSEFIDHRLGNGNGSSISERPASLLTRIRRLWSAR
ncbi:SRPBCC family protein [Zafaria sp. J156]|uniref:SRPBCC family protein n=1 Tax=Zafaria sp. J156 TaxID=3116490 RepID=UPI003D36403E